MASCVSLRSSGQPVRFRSLCRGQQRAQHLVHRHPIQSRQQLLCTAQATGPGSSGQGGSEDSDLVYVAKLTGVSFAGAALIKYGSLLTPLAFNPNPVLAAALVFGVPSVYAVGLLLKSQKETS